MDITTQGIDLTAHPMETKEAPQTLEEEALPNMCFLSVGTNERDDVIDLVSSMDTDDDSTYEASDPTYHEDAELSEHVEDEAFHIVGKHLMEIYKACEEAGERLMPYVARPFLIGMHVPACNN